MNGATNRLEWVNRNTNAVPTAGQASPYTLFTYDGHGRMIGRDRKDANGVRHIFTFLWDGDDRLRQVKESTTTRLSATYAGDGLRVAKTQTWPGLPGGALSHTYSWGPGGVLHDTANGGMVHTPGLAQRTGATDRFAFHDWLGSTRYLADNTGNNFPSGMWYDAFGNRSATSGTDPFTSTDFQFAGGWGYQQEWASATEPGLGLEYLQQRYYDPAVGRFITQDPIGFAGGLNLYGYAGNNPVGAVDPTGLLDRKAIGEAIVNGAKAVGRGAMWVLEQPGKWIWAGLKRVTAVGLDPNAPTLQNANPEAYPGLAKAGKEASAFMARPDIRSYRAVVFGTMETFAIRGILGGCRDNVLSESGIPQRVQSEHCWRRWIIKDVYASFAPKQADQRYTTCLMKGEITLEPSDAPSAPSRPDVKRKLDELIAGLCSREEAASWASQWVRASDPSVEDPVVWHALLNLVAADMISIDRPFLYGEDDFRVWLEELRRPS